MAKKLKCILIICFIIGLLSCTGCAKRNEALTETTGETVKNVIQHYTVVEIGYVDDETAAEVKIATPNLVKIYMDMREKNPDVDLSIDEIVKAIAEYAKSEEFLVTSTVVTSVEKVGNNWELSSEKCIDEVIREQVNDLILQMVNEIAIIEVKDISEELK